MLLEVLGVLVMATASLAQCPINCRCSDYVRKTFCQGSCDSSLPSGINPNTVDFSAVGFNLTVLKRTDFRGLTSLTDLSLEDNHVFVIEADAFHNLTQLVTLNLQDNLFDSLDPDIIAANTRLVVLYLSQNSELRFPQNGSFLNSGSLRSLFLESCRKLRTRFDYNSSSEVRVLDMKYFSGLKNLKELSVRNSGIDVLDVSYQLEPWGLISLNLRNNFLETIPSEFFISLSSLEVLYLDNNKLEHLPVGVFNPLKSLKKLFLGNNNLDQLKKGLFVSLSRLELLDLSENNLSHLEKESFQGLSNLHSLKLSGNVLERLDSWQLWPLKNLETLDLSENKFKVMEATWFTGLENLDEVRLADMSLPCDCTLRHFWQDMIAERIQIVATCGSTSQLSNDTFSSLDCTLRTSAAAGSLGTPSVIWISVGCSLAVLLLVIATIATYVFCRRRRTIESDNGSSYSGVPTSEIYALPMKPNKPRPPPRPPRINPGED